MEPLCSHVFSARLRIGAVHKRRPHSGGEGGLIDLRTFADKGGFLECGRPYFNVFRDGKSQIVLFRFRFSIFRIWGPMEIPSFILALLREGNFSAR